MEAETVIDSYPLSPMQQGMLFHSIATREQGVDIEQILCRLREPMDAQAFERSWQHAIKRHAVLRTGFSGDASNEPRQQVYAIVRFGLVERDWRHLSAQEQQHRLECFLQEDRQRGFNLSQPPLLRVALLRLADADYQFVWTFSHLLLDARAFSPVLKDVFAFYQAFRRDETLETPQPQPYRDYIDWLGQQKFHGA